MDAYKGICELVEGSRAKPAQVLHGSAANLAIPDKTVDVICVDPPYYNNVQYAELSDFFYVWQKRTLGELYPDIFNRRLTNKRDEAVANPVRDGSAKEANAVYEQRMSEIFAECRRVIKDDGVLTMMFTHKTQAAWETLTRALIENGWIISATFPVDSEFAAALNQKDLAAAVGYTPFAGHLK
jgi:adenine-specific DNA methylase